MPFLFGAAELIENLDDLTPNDITDKLKVEFYKDK